MVHWDRLCHMVLVVNPLHQEELTNYHQMAHWLSVPDIRAMADIYLVDILVSPVVCKLDMQAFLLLLMIQRQLLILFPIFQKFCERQ